MERRFSRDSIVVISLIRSCIRPRMSGNPISRSVFRTGNQIGDSKTILMNLPKGTVIFHIRFLKGNKLKCGSETGENYKLYLDDNFDLFGGTLGGQSSCETH